MHPLCPIKREANIMKIKNEVTIGIRLASMLVDHFIMTFAMFIPFIPFMIIGIKDAFNITHEQTSMEPSFIIYGFILGFAMYFNKDFFDGRSPAKRILKIQVINHKTGKVAGPLKCLLRNLTIPIWPLEAIFILINPQRRLGDYIAGTRIESYDSENIKQKKELKDYVLPIAIGLLFTYLISLPFSMLSDSWKQADVKYIQDSNNPDLSSELTSFLSYRLRNYSDSSSIKLYEKIENDSLKYVSLLFYTNNEDLLESSSKFNRLKQMIIDTLDLKIAKASFILSGKIIYMVPGHVQIKYMHYSPREKETHKLGSGSDYINDSTKVLKAFYDNGQQESEAIYVHGKLYGKYKEWYENGNLKNEIEYVDGMRNGLTTTYYSNGQKESEMLYENNIYTKDLNKWDEMGREIPIENE
jgi:antitoxin component YwqK of YwqJK toxin-antitoxin module